MTSSGPRHSSHAYCGPRALVLPHSRQDRAVALPSRGAPGARVAAVCVVMGRGLSPIFPSDHLDRRPDLAPVARWPRLTEVRIRDGCRGFTGPIPPPLWMRYSVVMPLSLPRARLVTSWQQHSIRSGNALSKPVDAVSTSVGLYD